jgi:flagellar hook-basal body complex protein FliE
MASGILPISPIQGIGAATGVGFGAPATTPAADSAFSSAFANAVKKVESFQLNAKERVNRFLSGEGEEIHKVALAAEQADLSFQIFLQARNKVVSAYQEVMRMQI